MRDDPQRLTHTEQLEILTLLETASTERSAMRAARALAQLMRHLHALGQRIAVELPDQHRNGRPTVR
jgi:EAL domain-containing protein (putative c-di-GMP-specific phosphodiesterase class I)